WDSGSPSWSGSWAAEACGSCASSRQSWQKVRSEPDILRRAPTGRASLCFRVLNSCFPRPPHRSGGEAVMCLAERLAQWIWDPWLLALFLGTGAWFTLRSGCFPLRWWRIWLGGTLGSLRRDRRGSGAGLTPLQTLATALGSTV